MAARIPTGTNLVGPFKGTVKPTRPGLYIRVSAATGQKVWAMFNGRQWGLYADTMTRAKERAHKRSKKSLDWYGTTAPVQAPAPTRKTARFGVAR